MSFKNINWSPDHYQAAAIVAQKAEEEMLSRLEWMTLQPQVIVDVGCGIGQSAAFLQNAYPKAQVIAMDLSEAMIQHAHITHPAMATLCANTELLPLRSQ